MSDPATTATTAGYVRGQQVPGGILFTAVPFAEPPVGSLRLRPPQPLVPWTGVVEADVLPPAPAQGGTALGGGAAMPWASDEDCLYLNLFTPELNGARPVIVWIYGGGFEIGTASPPMTDVANLGRATGAVVVAMNYRVGALGWLHLADLGGPEWAGSTNLGLQDQIAALHWVRENIAAFGGDPGNVTLAGESAGAFSIGALLAADPLGPEFGTPHGTDIAYIFDMLDLSGMGSPASRAVRDDLHQAWRRFAETGDPGWPRYDPAATDNTRLVAAPAGLITEPPHDEVTAHWR